MLNRLKCRLKGHDWALAHLRRSRKHDFTSWVTCCQRCGTWDEFGTPSFNEEFWDALEGV